MTIPLKRLQIRNFKAWENTGDINFGNITLLYGTNSAGKSSLIQFLLLLKQTIDSSDDQRVLLSGSSSGGIDLGTVTDFFTQHDLTRKISFELDSDIINFECTIGTQEIGKEGVADLSVESFKYYLNKEQKSVSLILKNLDKKKYTITSDGFDLTRKLGRAWPLSSPLKFYKFPRETVEYYKDAWDLLSMVFELEKLFSNIIYIGPLRQSPPRTYEWSGEKPSNVGRTGEYVVNAILSAENEGITLNMGKNKRYKSFMQFIAEWLRELGLVEDFYIKKIGKDSKVYKLQVRISKNSPWVDIADTGFGVSQILPILVQAYYAPTGSIIILEQPEIHLHPKVQSILADVFINAAKERGIQFIIESHSEHLLRRMQLRIAEKNIDKDFVKTYFCRTEGGKSVIENLETDDYGNIVNWPENFFGDEVQEMENFIRAQINAKKNEK